MAEQELQCWNCGASLDELPRPLSRHNNCPECFNDLHCCRLCIHFRKGETVACIEERADPPVEKEIANFCEFFQPMSNAYTSGTVERRDATRGKLDALFSGRENDGPSSDTGDAPDQNPSTREDDAKAKLEALFGKNKGDSV